MIDIHNHIIPGVDDGSKSINESIEMINQMISIGYTGAILTSHYDKSRYLVGTDLVSNGLKLLNEELEKRNINFNLYPGNEIQLDLDTVKLLKDKKINSLNNGKYVLIEFPFLTVPNYAKDLIFNLQLEGYIVIIAHPERYKYVQTNPDFLLEFIKSGCLLQLNLSSLTDSESNSNTAKNLISRNMIHLAATDTHSSTWRNPLVSNELDILKSMVSEETFNNMTTQYPKKIINNEFISSNYDCVVLNSNDDRAKPKKKWFKFW